MGRIQRKFESGAATAYVSRNKALKKLQLTLPDFRRLCILKGIYPHEPKHKKTVGKGSTAPKTYYYKKDIQYLLHEPIVNKFRDFKVFVKKLRKAAAKGEGERAQTLRDNKPKYKLDHIVKERYPTFIDALRDLDDCLSMLFLFATFPKTKKTHSEVIRMCRRLSVEFLHYVISSRCLRKVFISIKGIYYQVEILGQTITWVVPHKLGYQHPSDVDYKIMATFVEFYATMLGFVNFRLYSSVNLVYPPKLVLESEQDADSAPDTSEKSMCSEFEKLEERLAALTQALEATLNSVDEAPVDTFNSADIEDPDHVEAAKIEQEQIKHLQVLFKDCRFFLGREVPREALTFIIRACAGTVSWDYTVAVGATYSESDEAITHQVVDRPNPAMPYMTRYYIQPQWVFDCINARKLLPVEDYFPGAVLPPHLSPFVVEEEGDYVPPERVKLLQRANDEGVVTDSQTKEDENENGVSTKKRKPAPEQQPLAGAASAASRAPKKAKLQQTAEDGPKVSQPMTVRKGQVEVEDVSKKLKKQQDEEKKLSELTIPKKHRRLYNKIMYSRKKKAQEVNKLKQKREAHDRSTK